MKAKTKHKGKRKKVKVEEVAPVTENPVERSFENIIQRQRTEYKNDEGYHFIRPDWHRWVYGGGKKGDKG